MVQSDDQNKQSIDASNTLEELETLLSAAVLTSSPIDTSTHGKLFTSSSEFYDPRNSSIPDSLRPLDVSSAMQGLEALAKAKRPSLPPASRPGRQFGRQAVYSHHRKSKSRSRSPSSPAVNGKVEADEVKELDSLGDQLVYHQAQVLNDLFLSLTSDSQCERLDQATAFVNYGLSRISHFATKTRARVKMATYRGTPVKSSGEVAEQKRNILGEELKTFHTQICVLYAPLLAERPLVIDAGKSSSYTRLTMLIYPRLCLSFGFSILGPG